MEVHFVELWEIFTLDDIDKSYQYYGCLIYQDANHLSDGGEKIFWRKILDAVDFFSFNAYKRGIDIFLTNKRIW